MGTGEVWLLQQDVKALRHSVASAVTLRPQEHRTGRPPHGNAPPSTSTPRRPDG
eukprot:CAMPEP_0198686562 /NCGR_PEP_ID=MMETSP1468-20131203/15064_1 /TAXON_ID=1461545 /ORGANISM="Mantoniella sp, Strain CCMP1436" /LENGTH=53 /DNA_ID=CAMNT_0044432751 /DNA_START=117 /DNA_END=278 /DNA_ORIENTATION=+